MLSQRRCSGNDMHQIFVNAQNRMWNAPCFTRILQKQ